MEHQPRDLPSNPVPPPQVFHSTAHGVAGLDGRSVDLPDFPDDVYAAVADILIAAASREDAEAVTAS